jgi:3-deoxy-D-manno-octulosonic acid (KDO) 8-phosphate synthase
MKAIIGELERSAMKTVTVDRYAIANDKPFTLLAGPCVLESREHAFKMCRAIMEITDRLGINLIYKTSFGWGWTRRCASSRTSRRNSTCRW